MNPTANNNGTIICTIGGTLLSVLSNIHSDDIIKTSVLAAVGAVVSFGVSCGLRWMGKGLRSRNPK